MQWMSLVVLLCLFVRVFLLIIAIKKLDIDVIELENQGRIKNVDDWVSFFNRGNKSNDNIQNLLVELQEAKRVSGSIRNGEINS